MWTGPGACDSPLRNNGILGDSVARPLWLRLFGPNGPTTIAELRDALSTLQFGGGADGQVAARMLERLGQSPLSDEATARGQDPASGESAQQVRIADLIQLIQLSSDPLTPPASEARKTPDDPVAAADGAGDRIISLQVGLNPEIFEIPKLVVESGEQPETSQNGFVGGWLETYLLFFARRGTPGFEFHNATPGDLDHWTSVSGPADARIDTLALSGDFSAGFTLSRLPANIGAISLREGNDYVLIARDDFLAAGRELTVHGEALRESGHVVFDGSAETDGRFSFFGGDGDDIFFGGSGADILRGLGGADTLTGGGGNDVFVYQSAFESSGANFDILADFKPGADKIDLPGTVSGFDAAIISGSLSEASFSQNLGAAMSGLGAGRAVLFTPNAGDLAGTLFLVVDGNGIAGYQDGQDYVFALPGTSLADLAAHPAIFV